MTTSSFSYFFFLIFVRTHFWQSFRGAWHRIPNAKCLHTHMSKRNGIRATQNRYSFWKQRASICFWNSNDLYFFEPFASSAIQCMHFAAASEGTERAEMNLFNGPNEKWFVPVSISLAMVMATLSAKVELRTPNKNWRCRSKKECPLPNEEKLGQSFIFLSLMSWEWFRHLKLKDVVAPIDSIRGTYFWKSSKSWLITQRRKDHQHHEASATKPIITIVNVVEYFLTI